MRSSASKFCIVTTQRTGSSWLISLLNSHPRIRAFDEPFLYRKIRPNWKEEGFLSFYNFRHQFKLHRPLVTFRYMNAMYSFAENFEAVGFKLMYNQLLMFPEILFRLIKDRFVVIHLVRRNILDILVSLEIAQKTKVAHSNKELPLIKVTLNPESILKKMKKIEYKICITRLLTSFILQNSIEIGYESLMNKKEKTLSAILQIINIEERQALLRSDSRKLSKGSYREKIRNYEEIFNVLRNTKYKSMLLDGNKLNVDI